MPLDSASATTEPSREDSSPLAETDGPSLSKENALMLDVHPARHAANTLRDFFIHIATICVGLLIAIGLEQTVEALHHHHERGVLLEEMRAEAERNAGLLRTNIDRNLEKANWNRDVMIALKSARPQNGSVAAILPAHEPFLPQISPSRAVWSVAKTNGKVALLSEREAEIYDRLDAEADDESLSEDRQDIALTGLRREEVRLNIQLDSGSTVTLASSEVPALVLVLADAIAAADEDALKDAFYLGAARAVADNVHDREDFVPYLQEERLAVEKRLAGGKVRGKYF
jgi:hypothetical protein